MSTLFSRAFNFVLALVPQSRHRGNTPVDIDSVDIAVDIAVDEDLTVFDLEILQLDDTGAVVGMTAIIKGLLLELSDGKLPQR
jgi:hypothetical protein